MEKSELAFEHWGVDSCQLLHRIVYWSTPDRYTGRRMRMTEFYTDRDKMLAAIERRGRASVICTQTFAIAPTPAGADNEQAVSNPRGRSSDA